jgi:ATP-dependent DNA helicase PIF1
MEPFRWESDTIPSVAIEQIPLILAWALTIHKSQGCTLESAEMNLGDTVFEYGQTYVALSRVKSLDGLYLTEFQPSSILVNPKVKNFIRQLEFNSS